MTTLPTMSCTILLAMLRTMASNSGPSARSPASRYGYFHAFSRVLNLVVCLTHSKPPQTVIQHIEEAHYQIDQAISAALLNRKPVGALVF